MRILSLDTSSRQFSLAVSKDDQIIRSSNVKLNKVLSSSIIPAIDRILKKSGLQLSDLDGIAVGLGPGSFTSLRVGLSTIKAFAFDLQKPIVGISSLDVLAMVVKEDMPICSLTDAKRKLVYACFYEKKKGMLKRISPYQLVSISEVLDQVKGETMMVGDAIGVYREEMEKWDEDNARRYQGKRRLQLAGEKFWYPQARFLAALALERFQQKKIDDPADLMPLYLYPEDCQIDGSKTRPRK